MNPCKILNRKQEDEKHVNCGHKSKSWFFMFCSYDDRHDSSTIVVPEAQKRGKKSPGVSDILPEDTWSKNGAAKKSHRGVEETMHSRW